MTQTSSRTREWYPYPLYLHWQLSPGKIRCRGEKKLVFCRAISTAPETRILLFSLVFDQPLTPHILKGYSVLFGSFVFSLSSIVLRACGCVRMHFSTVLVIAFQHCTHDSLTCATQDLTYIAAICLKVSPWCADTLEELMPWPAPCYLCKWET